MRVFLLDGLHQLAKFRGATDTGHILQSDLLGTVLHIFIDHREVVLQRVYGRVRDAERGLRDESELVGVFDGEFQIAVVVEAAEGAHHIDALGLLDLEHQPAHVGGYGVHAQPVEGAFQHLALDAGSPQWLRPLAHRVVGVLAVHQVHLLESAAVGLHTVEASHPHDYRGDFRQLVNAGLILARRLPHITIHQTEFDSLCHNYSFLNIL